MASTLAGTALSGITTVAVSPAALAAYATACAWLPDECVTTPVTRSSSRSTALVAPRSLNAPVGCRLSGLTHSGQSTVDSNGVRSTRPRIRSAAATTSSSVTGRPRLPTLRAATTRSGAPRPVRSWHRHQHAPPQLHVVRGHVRRHRDGRRPDRAGGPWRRVGPLQRRLHLPQGDRARRPAPRPRPATHPADPHRPWR